ncbi:transporter substrate-binding domain-containing protein [Aestuariibacter halophilus]|uniref:Transporter substrate-binding domain-containing protein n=1 Tax=Fluctibacter halophilus TaxID=226011 RepID=A0ABS8GCZ5_9ALTE|nr:transporter substrate-binding domain-containing protein [Aestuariibacter halophilus]MCC2617730.1 transporter substrate-binding domain-containing protein [Aestuariibacter halophilus]
MLCVFSRIRLIALFSLIWLPFDLSADDSASIRYLNNTDTIAEYGDYFIALLALAVDKSTPQYESVKLTAIETSMRQSRQFLSLQAHQLDVMWTVTNREREQQALPVRIPLLKGLIGHRVFLIRAKDQSRFDSITTLRQLGQLVAVQGHDWPDVAILEHAGLQVAKETWHATLGKLVQTGIVDYFPRSVLEVLPELDILGGSLAVEQQHLLVYPSAMYFFVDPSRPDLAQRLEYGLRKAIEDGSFEQLFLSYPAHKRALDTLKLEQRRVHRLDNPTLPDNTPLNDDALWMTPFSSE